MQESKARTLSLPRILFDTPPEDIHPAVIWKAGDTPLRVLVRNISGLGMNMQIGYDLPSLTSGSVNAQATFTLPPGISEVFPLMPGESLYGASVNLADGLVSVIISEAFPFEIKNP